MGSRAAKRNVLLLSLWAYSGPMLAVETPSLPRRFVLVGVISDDQSALKGKLKGKGKGVAVLKDLDNKVTLTIETGTNIPYSPFVVQRIERQLVILREGDKTIEVRHEGAALDEAKEATASNNKDSQEAKTSSSIAKLLNGSDDYNPEFEDLYASELESDLWFFDNLRRQESDDESTPRRRSNDIASYPQEGIIFDDKAFDGPKTSGRTVDDICIGAHCGDDIIRRSSARPEAEEKDQGDDSDD